MGFSPLGSDPYVLQAGTEAGEVLLLHGGGSDPVADFGDLVDTLASGRRLLATHLPGSGPRPKAGRRLELDDIVTYQMKTADRAGFRYFDVVAYSLGCPIAIRLAAQHPEAVRRLVLVAGFAAPDHRLRMLVALWRRLLLQEEHLAMGQLVATATASDATFDSTDVLTLAKRVSSLANNFASGLDDHLELIERLDVSEDLASVQAPTLVIAGKHDRLATPKHSRRIAQGIAIATYHELPTGHMPISEATETAARAITDFLRLP